MLNALSIDNVVAVKSLNNKCPHASPFDLTDIRASETFDEYAHIVTEVKRSLVLC